MKDKEKSPDAVKRDDQKEPEVKLSRREAVLKAAVALGATAVAIYVPPKLRPFPVSKVFAKAAPANKESCEKNPTSEKDPNEDCTKCVRDKDPSEKDCFSDKSGDKSPKESGQQECKDDPMYDKCVQDKPCDKDPTTDKDPNADKGTEGSGPQTDPRRFAGPIDEWG